MDTLQIATLSEVILEREAQRSESEARDIIHELDSSECFPAFGRELAETK